MQAVPHSLPVPYAWGIHPTESSNVMPPPSGMGLTKPLPNAFEANCCYIKTTNPSALTGSTREVAQQTTSLLWMQSDWPWSSSISLSSESLGPLLPTDQTCGSTFSHKLVSFLSTHTSPTTFILASSSSFLPLCSPKPHPIILPSSSSFPSSWRSYKTSSPKVVTSAHYPKSTSSPSSDSFNCPHFSIIPKPAKLGRFQVLQNYSFPYEVSAEYPNLLINSFISPNDFPTTWGTFSITCLLLHHLPPGSQITTRDISEAYRTVPLHQSQWPATIAHLSEDSFTVNTSLCFGSSPLAGTYGEIC